ncbi:MAG: hypothetical protein UFA98_11735 [Ruminococcus sp.]|nr:hypothetical protein [Ruminococcus sp.]
MIEYTISVIDGKKKIPVIEFSDSQYDLIGELFLAERSFLSKIKKFLKDENKTEFTANVFSITKAGEEIQLENDITEQEITVGKDDFTLLLNAYYNEYKKLKK